MEGIWGGSLPSEERASAPPSSFYTSSQSQPGHKNWLKAFFLAYGGGAQSKVKSGISTLRRSGPRLLCLPAKYAPDWPPLPGRLPFLAFISAVFVLLMTSVCAAR